MVAIKSWAPRCHPTFCLYNLQPPWILFSWDSPLRIFENSESKADGPTWNWTVIPFSVEKIKQIGCSGSNKVVGPQVAPLNFACPGLRALFRREPYLLVLHDVLAEWSCCRLRRRKHTSKKMMKCVRWKIAVQRMFFKAQSAKAMWALQRGMRKKKLRAKILEVHGFIKFTYPTCTYSRSITWQKYFEGPDLWSFWKCQNVQNLWPLVQVER